MSRNKIPDKEEYGHDDMFCDRNNVRAGDLATALNQWSRRVDDVHLQNLDIMVDCSV
jgi:hypothetical protein